MKTHHNFKTVNPKFSHAGSIYNYIEEALSNQHRFDKITTPWEKKQWDELELQNFKINVEDIDRLYYIYHFDDDQRTKRYKLVVRMKYSGGGYRDSNIHKQQQEDEHNHLYVELFARYDIFNPCMMSQKQVIFVSRDPNLFMKLVLKNKCQKPLIHQFLAEDGIIIDQQQTDYDAGVDSTVFWKNGWDYIRVFWNNPPSLKYFCHQKVCDNKTVLNDCYPKILPKMLSNSVKDFIIFQEAKQIYSRFLHWKDIPYFIQIEEATQEYFHCYQAVNKGVS